MNYAVLKPIIKFVIEFLRPYCTHLYKLNGAWSVAGESVARDDLRLYLGHDGEHDLHLADHRVSSLKPRLLKMWN